MLPTLRPIGAFAVMLALGFACGGQSAGSNEPGVGGEDAAGAERPAATPEIAIRLFAGEQPGPALDTQGRLIAPSGVVGRFEHDEDGTIRFRSADGRVRAWVAPDGAIHTPLSTLDARIDEEAQLIFGEEAIFIDEEGRVTGSVAQEGLRFVGVDAERRREAIFLLVIVMSMATSAG